MTDFEEEIAQILCDALGEARCPDHFPEASNYEKAAHIAPRVAAAIEIAGRMVADGYVIARANHGAALAALRGSI